MPAALSRVCPSCHEDRPTADFRDLGDVTHGRPPRVCRFCRSFDTKLQARAAANRARRAEARAQQRAYADRIPEQVSLARIATHPDGLKTCPPFSGCGKGLPFSAFAPDPYQHDGLSPVCADCREAASTLRRSA